MKTSSLPMAASRGAPMRARAWAACAVLAIACDGAPEVTPEATPDQGPSTYRLRTTYRAEMRVTAMEITLAGEPPYRTDNANPPGSERICLGEIEYREDGELGTREYLLCRRSTVTSRNPDLMPSGKLDYPEDRSERGAFEGCTIAWPADPADAPVASCKTAAPGPREEELRELRRERPGLLAALRAVGVGASLEPGQSWELPAASVRELVLVSQPPWLEGSPIFPPALLDPFGALRNDVVGHGTAKVVSVETPEGGTAQARIELVLELRGSIPTPTPSSSDRDDRTSSELQLAGTLLWDLAEPRSATLRLAGPLRTNAVATLDWQGTRLVQRLLFGSDVLIEQTLQAEPPSKPK